MGRLRTLHEKHGTRGGWEQFRGSKGVSSGTASRGLSVCKNRGSPKGVTNGIRSGSANQRHDNWDLDKGRPSTEI